MTLKSDAQCHFSAKICFCADFISFVCVNLFSHVQGLMILFTFVLSFIDLSSSSAGH